MYKALAAIWKAFCREENDSMDEEAAACGFCWLSAGLDFSSVALCTLDGWIFLR